MMSTHIVLLLCIAFLFKVTNSCDSSKLKKCHRTLAFAPKSTHQTRKFCRWTACNYSQFWGLTLAEGIARKLGTFKPKFTLLKMTPLHVKRDKRLRRSFDARKKWPNYIHPVRNQGDCAASWAFSTTALASDRFAIQSGGRINVQFSPQQLISCNVRDQLACKGGNVDRAWWYFRKSGIVSETCYPYTSGYRRHRGKCYVKGHYRQRYRGKCPGRGNYDRYNTNRATPPYRISTKEWDIMQEIKTNGPVQATFLVNEDFYSYKSGVYRYSRIARSDPLIYRLTAFHSVRIIGWGEDNTRRRPIKYWLCANSWGTQWGEQGYFRIFRGANESGIESFILGVWGKGPRSKRRVNQRRSKIERRRKRHRRRQ